jgi:hypothetical protein
MLREYVVGFVRYYHYPFKYKSPEIYYLPSDITLA